MRHLSLGNLSLAVAATVVCFATSPHEAFAQSHKHSAGSCPDDPHATSVILDELFHTNPMSENYTGPKKEDLPNLPNCSSPTGKAAYDIGEKYYYGRGVAQNYFTAMRWYTQAGNYGPALSSIAYQYHEGLGVTQDYSQAAYWFNKAISAGNIGSLIPLGYMYETGQGVVQNYAKAFSLYRKAAEHGDAVGMYDLAVFYAKGTGVTQNSQTAIQWYRKAISRATATGNTEVVSKAEHDIDVLTSGGSSYSNNDASAGMQREQQEQSEQEDYAAHREIEQNTGMPQ